MNSQREVGVVFKMGFELLSMAVKEITFQESRAENFRMTFWLPEYIKLALKKYYPTS